jgi:SnoaL-like polyketide cyclase
LDHGVDFLAIGRTISAPFLLPRLAPLPLRRNVRADGNKVLIRFIWSGTHRGEFLGIPATHRVVRVWGMVIDRFENGKVKSTRILLDTLDMMQQLGVVPESDSNPNAAL